MKKQPTINPNDFVSVESGSEDVYVPLNEEIDVYDVDKAIDEVNGVVVAGSTEDKIDYLDETKTDIREAIINKGVDVSETEPFRSYAEKIGDIEGGEVHNQDKTITENGTYTYDEGYTGLGEVVVEVPSEEPVLETLNVVENGTYMPSGNVDGYDEVIVNVPETTLGELSVTENGVYEPTSVDGYNRVEVDVNPPLQDKTITTNGTFTADSGYYGLDEVTVDIDTVHNQDKTITENGTYTADSGYTGLGTVVVNTPVVNNENKTIRVNGTYTAGAGYTGLGEVVVDVADIPAVVEPLSVTPTTSQQVITPPANVDGFNKVTVDAVTSSIDANISAGNIKSGVSILGVQGSVVELNGETTTVTPTTSQQVITPTGQHNALTEVTVEAVDASIDSDIIAGNIKSGVSILGVNGSVVELNADSLSVTPTTSAQTITPTSPYNAFDEVSVSAVTSSIDANISAGNIKSGVSILGVNGSVVEANETTLNVTPSTSEQTLTPTGAYTGFDEVNVSAVDSSIDVNIIPENIKSGVSILGVNGSVVELDGETTTVTPTTSQQVITPTGQHNGLTEVTIEAVDASIDSDIIAGNIKSGVNILGVSGSVVELNADSLSVTPTTSAQTITPTSPYNAFDEVSVSAVTSSIDSNITAGNIKSGVSILGVNGSVVELNGETTTVTPTTSQQTITPSGVHNGLTEVVVDAVDATIDNNIQSGNIKSGVSILGVSGSVVELNGGTASVTPTTSSQVITPTSPVNGFTRIEVDAVDSSIDANITAGNIKSGVSILGVNGSVIELNGTTETVTPTTSQQVITPTSPYNGLISVTVNAVTSSVDANITAGNIKDGVTILGIQGTYTGSGITPTGTKNITANGVYDITNYANVDVAVPTTAPAHYAEKENSHGILKSSKKFINLIGINDIGSYALAYEYDSVAFDANTSLDMSMITSITGYSACQYMFSYASGVVNVDLSGLVSIDGPFACQSMFAYASNLVSVQLDSLQRVTSTSACSRMLSNTNITQAEFPSLELLDGEFAFQNICAHCSSLTRVDMSALRTISKQSALAYAFYGCTSLTTMVFSSLKTVSAYKPLEYCFSSCSSLTSLYFPALKDLGNTFTNQFDYMLYQCSGVTVHFPSNLQSVIGSWTDVQNGFGGTNTTVLFDLPATNTLEGMSSDEYERNPKYDTPTALAWYETSGTMSTPYYTSGTTDPVVNDAIYSDAACTTQVDTIASIS